MGRWRLAFLVSLPALLMFVATVIVSRLSDVPPAELTQDPSALVGYPFYLGLFSHLGILLWAAAAAIGAFAWAVLRASDRERARYFGFAALLSALFAFDDLLLLHEEVLPHRVGIDEFIVLGAFGLVSLAFLVRHYGRIVVEGPGLLTAAVASLGVSVLLDLWDPSDVNVLVEDAFKLLGIGCWLGHFARAAARSLRPEAT